MAASPIYMLLMLMLIYTQTLASEEGKSSSWRCRKEVFSLLQCKLHLKATKALIYLVMRSKVTSPMGQVARQFYSSHRQVHSSGTRGHP